MGALFTNQVSTMRTYCYRHSLVLLATGLLLGTAGLMQPARAQDAVPAPEPLASPADLAYTQLPNGTYVKVTYHSPRMRGREIFGDLVPYGEVWRLGANEATELTTTGDINFGGEPLEAGTYSLFAIPAQDTWTIIVNRGLGQWGAYNYNEQADVMRVEVPAAPIDSSFEAFTIRFDEAEGGADLVMAWDQTEVKVPIGMRVGAFDRPSPMSMARTTLSDGTYVKVHYSAPRKRDREIFGALVPYGELWRTAANEATEITFTQDVRFGGQPVEAGTYSLFTIPGEQTWTVILNRGLGLNGTADYDQAQDVARVEVPAQQTRATYEPFTIRFADAEQGTSLQLAWDQTLVSVPIEPAP